MHLWTDPMDLLMMILTTLKTPVVVLVLVVVVVVVAADLMMSLSGVRAETPYKGKDRVCYNSATYRTTDLGNRSQLPGSKINVWERTIFIRGVPRYVSRI